MNFRFKQSPIVWRFGGLAAILCTVALPLLAQGADPGAMASQYAANAKANAALTRQYTWQMRVEVTLKGEPKPAQLYQMRFDMDGKLQKTLLSAPQEEQKSRGIRGKIKEGKIEDFKEWAAKLAELVKGYMAPTPGTMMDFYTKAKYSQSADGKVMISANGFVQPGDYACYWIDPATKIPCRYEFQTVLDGDPVSAKVEFGQVPGGPQYTARLVVSVPEKKVSAKIENFSYQRQ
jgi:hypothetical protein